MPTNGLEQWYEGCYYGTIYGSTVSLLPTHRPETNAVVARNRRLGVGLMDFITWKRDNKLHEIIKYLRKGYNIIRETNNKFNAEAGVPPAIKVTTVKPGGTIPKLSGKIPGIGQPTFDYTLRRVRVAENHPITEILKNANIPWEHDVASSNTLVFEFPIRQGDFRYVSLWEQAINLILIQREWADNSVSNTLYFIPKWEDHKSHDTLRELWDEGYFDSFFEYQRVCNELENPETTTYIHKNWKFTLVKDQEFDILSIGVMKMNPNHEEDILENVVSFAMAHCKTLSMLPHSKKGAYKQVPEEGLTPEEYIFRKSQIKSIDWKRLMTVGEGTHFCDNDTCQV